MAQSCTRDPFRAPFRASFRLGLIINPIAGLGGTVAFKGTEGNARQRALQLGARPRAGERAARALARLGGTRFELLAAAGEMGESIARAAGFAPIVVGESRPNTTAADTVAAAREMRRRGADLVLFAGGDGTARDVFSAIDRDVAMLGIPTGVKMHSAVFATTPENAGLLAGAAVQRTVQMRDAELLDRDEAGLPGVTRLYGVARVPYEIRRMQHAKCAGRPPQAALQAACAALAASLAPGVVHLFGPGMTTQCVLAELGLAGSLFGVDAVRDGALLGTDLTEAEILHLVCGQAAQIVVGVVGGQGFLFGRGNQQISAAVIRAVGPGRIIVIADAEKILSLADRALFVDTGEPGLDAELAGYRRVQTGPGQWLLARVVA